MLLNKVYDIPPSLNPHYAKCTGSDHDRYKSSQLQLIHGKHGHANLHSTLICHDNNIVIVQSEARNATWKFNKLQFSPKP